MALVSTRFATNGRLQSAAQNSPPLKKGEPDRTAVALMQQALVDLGFPMPITMARGKADGIYGDETFATVQKFQGQQGLSKDGIAGHDTLHALDKLFAGETPKPPTGLPPLTARSVLTCLHGGRVQVFPTSPDGTLTAFDPAIVAACPFIGPFGFPSPCVRVQWIVSNPQVLVNGAPTLNVTSVGICLNIAGNPQGPVIILSV